MATIRAHEFITLDGVFESPSWTFEFGFDPEMGEDIGALTSPASTILLGRKTHEMFAPAWRDRTAEDDPGAPFFNDTEKLVVGSREPAEEWSNTTLFGPYDGDRLRELKESSSGDIYISGSGQLVRGLIADDLLATGGTAKHLESKGIPVTQVNKVAQGRPHIVDRLLDGDIDLVFNTTEGWQSLKDSHSIRTTALQKKVPYFTTAAASLAAARSIEAVRGHALEVASLQSYYSAA